MSIATPTCPPDSGTVDTNRPSRTTVRVELDARGRVAVHMRTTGCDRRPRLRPMLLSSTVTSARVCLVPEGALLLGGDQIQVRIDVGAGANLELIEPAGTVAYDMRGGRASWDVEVLVGAGGRLVWGGEPFVVSAGAVVRRDTKVHLGERARLVLRETLVLGRHGEPGGRVRQRFEATRADGSPLLVELLSIDEHPAFSVLGGRRVVSSVLALGLDVPPSLVPEGRYDLDDGGSWWRGLGDEVHRTASGEAWAAAVAASRG